MLEAIEIIRKLFTGKGVKHNGKYFKLETTRLSTLPAEPLPILIATAGPLTAKKTGMYADGLITVGAPESKIEMIFEKCREECREAGNDPTKFRFILQLHLSWADTDEEAMRNAMEEWPNGGMKFPKEDIRSPFDFEQMAKLVRPEDFQGRMLISTDPEDHRAYIQKFLDMGFDQVYFHTSVGIRPAGSRSSGATCSRSSTRERPPALRCPAVVGL